MAFSAKHITYKETKSFSPIVTDYIEGNKKLQPFYQYSPDLKGIKKAIVARKKHKVNRNILVAQLQEQYSAIEINKKVSDNIRSLLKKETYTICTAHQPNIFTGHLYFIYKIIHVIKLADELNKKIKTAHFVPVFYMGSEDADLEELGVVTINGKKLTWDTTQKGAVGRMEVDKAFIKLIEDVSGQLSVEPFGNEILDIVKRAYTIGKTIEEATLGLVNELFGKYGLLVLLPDNPILKKVFIPIAAKELTEQFSSKAVSETIALFPQEYKVQAAGRAINLFYLNEDVRERIEANGEDFIVANTSLSFSKKEMMKELEEHPERFSPNVILRPVFQEMILPNIAFIGGGGELAYWLELKRLFEKAYVTFPLLVLRNSFMIVRKSSGDMIAKLGFTPSGIFRTEEELIKKLVKHESAVKLDLDKERAALKNVYDKISAAASEVDPTLQQHIAALSVQAVKRVILAEKKMLSAEKKKFEAHQRQIRKIRAALFPGETLQERIDNLLSYYALWGEGFINAIYKASKGLMQEFCIIEEVKSEKVKTKSDELKVKSEK